ncbi:NnrU family protein [Rhodovulum marinum]|uniref:Putative membrane protein n=1 Tax=Rhodovulum marinum TaxID=320662 RepID=A0A4R2PRT0_9RHOB|nr:NnrU family protein [Rhodovulum marinum]TCP38613.1 putative membrane protein [Rhodovulum marinum]
MSGFFILHSIPVRPPVRSWLVRRLGRAGFGIAYSFQSLAMLGVLLVAANRAPYLALWPEPPGAHCLVLVATTAAILVLVFGLFRPNPLSFGGLRNTAFDPRDPGILRYCRHPVLLALLLWSGAHLIANGDLAHGLMFGSFALFSLLGTWAIDRRRQRDMGDEVWRRAVAQMRSAPMRLPPGARARFAGGLVAMALLMVQHPWLAGGGILEQFTP